MEIVEFFTESSSMALLGLLLFVMLVTVIDIILINMRINKDNDDLMNQDFDTRTLM